MPGFASSNFLTKLVPFMPVPVNQSFVWVPYWQMMTSSVMSSAIPSAAQESSIMSASINVANFFMRVFLLCRLFAFVESIINDCAYFVKNVSSFFRLFKKSMLLSIYAGSNMFNSFIFSFFIFAYSSPHAPFPVPAEASLRPPAPAHSPCPPCQRSGSCPSLRRICASPCPASPWR